MRYLKVVILVVGDEKIGDGCWVDSMVVKNFQIYMILLKIYQIV